MPYHQRPQTQSTCRETSASCHARSQDDDGPELHRLDPDAAGGLDGSESDSFGPLALLLIGYLPSEVVAVTKLMIELEADMVKIIKCTQEAAKNPLSVVLEGEQPEEVKRLAWPLFQRQPQQQRRMMVLSGMYTSEAMSVIANYREQGLPETVFCAAVPANYNRVITELLDDVYGDHEYMMAKDEAESSYIP